MGVSLLALTCVAFFATISQTSSFRLFGTTNRLRSPQMSVSSPPAEREAPLLVRALRGESVERTPVWLMRQAGRYMSAFREYSDRLPFRERSETPDIAVELSLQPWKRFGVDAVIMFSDILTPLPALGVNFDIVEKKGPKIERPIRSREDVDRLSPLLDVDAQLPFVGETLRSLRSEINGETALIGFVGAPWTLAAYSVEGGHSKLCKHMKSLCVEQPQTAHKLLSKYTDMLCAYAGHQIKNGAQVLQVFESWAHHLSEEQFRLFAEPYAAQLANHLKVFYPDVPIVYFANGGSPFFTQQLDMPFDALSLDWRMSMNTARRTAGPEKVLCGNVDPLVLYADEEHIRHAVWQCIAQANGRHVLNLGHGVEKDMREEAVEAFVRAAKEYTNDYQAFQLIHDNRHKCDN